MTEKDFCDKLKELAQRYGWKGDYTEVRDFVMWVHQELGVPLQYKDIEHPNDEP